MISSAYDIEIVREFTHSLVGIVECSSYERGRSILLAALDAIREPTQAQLDAVCSDDRCAEPFTDAIMRGVYRDMIDALKCEIAR